MWIFNLLAKAAFMIASRLMVIGVGSTVALAIGFTVVGTATLAAGQALGRMMAPPDIGLGQQGMSILSNAPSNSSPLPVIYGTRRVGGTRVFIGTSDGYDDDGDIVSQNTFLNMVFAVAEGPVAEISAVYLNSVEVWPNMDPRFDNGDPVKKAVYVETYTGKANQSASQFLINISNSTGGVQDDWAWTADHKLSGVAYVYLCLQYDPEIWAAGVPVMTCDVKGRIVEDSRPTVVPGYAFSIEKYSDNPALCIKDYLTNTTYGRGIDSALIGNTSFNAAANYCDELVTYTQMVNGVESTVSQKRYTLNGVVNTAETNMNSLGKMLSSCRGSLVFSGGFYKLVLDKAVTASITFDESNILPNYEIVRGGKSFLANQVAVNYFNPNAEWQADFTYEKSSTFLTEDNNLFLEKKLELPFTTNTLTAKHIALQTLKASRQNIIFNFKTTQVGLLAEVGDVVYINLEAPGWDTLNSNAGKEFRIIQMSIEANDEIMISAIEYDANVYSTETFTYDTSRNTNLPSLGTVAVPTNITAEETLLFNEPKITNRITLNWTKSLDSFVSSYDIGYMKGKFRLVEKINVSGTQANFDNLEPGLYNFIIRARNNAGYTSSYISKIVKVRGKTILPLVNPPGITGVTESLVTTTLGSGVKAKAVLSWVAVANPLWEALGVNVESYEVEFKLQSTSGNYERIGSSTGTFFEFTDIAPGIYNFRVRAVNDAGIKSDYAETATEITALSAPPANVANFYLRAESTQANLSWTPATDLDVKVGGTFEIRHSVATSGATWGVAIKVGSDVPGSSNSASMPLLVGTYLIKAVDSTGNKSTAATSIVNTVSPSLFDKRTQATITDTAFAGTKSDMVIDSDTGYLKFEADAPWDSVSGNVDEWGLVDSIGGADTSGYYEFSNKIDLGAVGNATLTSAITFNAVNTSDIWDNRLANIDLWDDIDANDFDDLNATMFIATTQQDPASGSATWTAYQEFTIGNYHGRGFKFKLLCTSGDPTHQINITQLVAKAEVYFRFESETVTTATSGSALTYTNAFLATPQIAITANDMATGDYYAITSSSGTGFTLRFYNASGAGISRTAYYLARGY